MLGIIKRNFKHLTAPTFVLLYTMVRMLNHISIIALLRGHPYNKNSSGSGDEIHERDVSSSLFTYLPLELRHTCSLVSLYFQNIFI